MARKQRRASSGAPGIQNGPGIGPALNPIGLSNSGPGQRYLDPQVAFEVERKNTAWNRFWDDEKAVARFSRPVQPRI